jgi:hypothetical protein
MSHRHVLAAACFAAFTGAGVAHADAVTDWNARAGTLVAAEKLAGAYGYRAMAIVQVATRDAVDAARRSKSASADDDAVRLAAAVAAANRATLAVVVPGHRADADAASAEALGALADSPARRDGIAAGERACMRCGSERTLMMPPGLYDDHRLHPCGRAGGGKKL